VKGHKLLFTSRVIVFKGKQFVTALVDGVSTASTQTSVNGIPGTSSYFVSVAHQGDTIAVNWSAPFAFGRSQYERLRKGVFEGVGRKLIVVALQTLMAGGTKIFNIEGHWLRKSKLLTVSNSGVLVGEEYEKAFKADWGQLRMQIINGKCCLSSYSCGDKITISLSDISNNMVFLGVLGHLLDKANYRLLKGG
jgi:hypothetical protein